MTSAPSKRLLALGVGLALAAVSGCPFVVVFPEALQTSSQDFDLVDNKVEIRVAFNRAVDMSSLIAGTNVILEMETDANADITIDPGETTRDIVITSVDDAGDLCVYNPDCFFTLHLRGSGANPIRDADGEALDGDRDGSAGGDYETTFVIIG
jgi:hypothetical protein